MSPQPKKNLRGRCRCEDLQFELIDQPLFVHACHCLHCKQKTGSSFGLTCIVLENEIRLTQGLLRSRQESSRTKAYVCSRCDTPIYRTHKAFKATAWLQTRCLEDIRLLNIGAHIWVKRKDDWLELPEDVPQFEEGYHRDGVWLGFEHQTSGRTTAECEVVPFARKTSTLIFNRAPGPTNQSRRGYFNV